MSYAAKPYSAAYVQAHIKERVIEEDRGHDSSCWIWQSGINGGGYGTGRPSGCKHGLIHRISYEAFVGPIPEGLQIDHLCRVRSCCNPKHLEPVTPRENTLRVVRANRPLHTHCVRGHAFTPENTRIERGRWRRCLTCYRLWKEAAAQKTGLGGRAERAAAFTKGNVRTHSGSVL